MAVIPNIPISIPNVPFYSQFVNIDPPSWKKVGCGVTSLAMVIDFYKPNAVSVDALLGRAIAMGAYDPNAGWIHSDLVRLSEKYGLAGTSYDARGLSSSAAFAQMKASLASGPVIASIHYEFDSESAIPHMIVVDGISGDTVYYNDPAAKSGEKQISITDFQKGWKKMYIAIRPVKGTGAVA